MKDLSLFLLKNTMTARMKKGFKSFCNGDGSTSTLNQQKMKLSEEVDNIAVPAVSADRESSLLMDNAERNKHEATTLEEMIMQLELEEKLARRREEEFSAGERSRMLQQQRRMSCVNSSDILRSARNALNQYPRFSLDGKDAMYRSSFRNFGGSVENNIDSGARRSTTNRLKSSCSCSCRICRHNHQYSYRVLKKNDERQLCSCNYVESRGIGTSGGGRGGQQLRPVKVIGDESCNVVWCKPGLVAKLMGLEAMPIPVLQLMNNGTNNNKMMTGRRLSTSSAVDNNFKKQNQLLRNRGREGASRFDSHNDNSAAYNKRSGTSDKNYYLHPSRSRITDNHIMIRRHVPMEEVAEFDEPGWPLRHPFL
ncbi:VARLMGL domain-containing protein [Heracleum sosnowskyi]|uniref:VARLMGL domain-containing protein n=1 Tax=Heracleum sosnowskyi TaxID=360622 RepID=A0AAD8HZX0_9APIA|nr:VARLMGL domain-containing protein [Heracleum sosnowskyi]